MPERDGKTTTGILKIATVATGVVVAIALVGVNVSVDAQSSAGEAPPPFRVDGVERAFALGHDHFELYVRDGDHLRPMTLVTSEGPVDVVVDAPDGRPMWVDGTKWPKGHWQPREGAAATAALHVHRAREIGGGTVGGKNGTSALPVE